jgi:hypothetical protein
VKGLMLHSVGCSQPKASAFINSLDVPERLLWRKYLRAKRQRS